MSDANDFFSTLSKVSDVHGHWYEVYRSSIISAIERTYKTSIIREYFIQELVDNGDKVLVKWNKRFEPLSDDELVDNYGKNILKRDE